MWSEVAMLRCFQINIGVVFLGGGGGKGIVGVGGPQHESL